MAPKRPDYEGSDGESYGKPSKRSRMMEKDTDEYLKRRERNNIAVKKSRERSRQKAKETIEQVNRLRAENEMLEQKVEILSKELSVLKDLFLAHAGNVAQSERAIEATESRAPIPDHQYSSSKQKQWLSFSVGTNIVSAVTLVVRDISAKNHILYNTQSHSASVSYILVSFKRMRIVLLNKFLCLYSLSLKKIQFIYWVFKWSAF